MNKKSIVIAVVLALALGLGLGAVFFPKVNNNFGAIKWSGATNTSISVAITSTSVLSANPAREYASLVNTGSNNVCCSYGTSTGAVWGKGVCLNANGGTLEIIPNPDTGTIWSGVIGCIATSSTSTIAVSEY